MIIADIERLGHQQNHKVDALHEEYDICIHTYIQLEKIRKDVVSPGVQKKEKGGPTVGSLDSKEARTYTSPAHAKCLELGTQQC